MRQLLPIALILIGLATPAAAQRSQPVGITTKHEAAGRPVVLTAPIDSARSESRWNQRGFWTWTGVGAAAGAIAGGILAAIQVARSDDDFFPTLAIALGTGGGALAGGLLGALTYTGSHPHNR
jgi:anti-sigma-K factor RskA